MEDNRPYGEILVDESKRNGQFSIISSRMNFAKIQELKKADRQATLKAFQGSDYEFLQRIKTDSPQELAAFLVERTKAAAAQGVMFTLMIMGGF